MNREILTIEKLIKICRDAENADSYAASPVYYMMTGRNGGMIFCDDYQSIIAINHPNNNSCILIFPAISKKRVFLDLSQEFIVAKRILAEDSTKQVRIARVPISLAEKYVQYIVEEDLLDWKYDVHILDAQEVVWQKGKGYQQVRQRLNNLNVEMCVQRQIDVCKDKRNILGIASKWASAFPNDEFSSEDLTSPTKILLELMENKELNIKGHIIYYGGIASAYCIWEEQKQIANAYAMSSDRNIAGLAEYNLVTMCRYLCDKGIMKVNVGGSESKGLDRYKRKFSPIQSIALKSCIFK